MKKIVLCVAGILGFFFHYLCCKKIVDAISYFICLIYSAWIKHEFCFCGEKSHFGYFGFLHGEKYISIGNNVDICQHVVLEVYDCYSLTNQKFSPELIIGDGTHIGDDSHVTCINKVHIGKHVLIGRKVLITDNAHGSTDRLELGIPPINRKMISKGPVIIEDNVWIGEMVCIMPNVTIGEGSIIGANAVVTHSVPPYCMVGGNPARILRRLE